jgi:hypothetical protein
VLRVVRMPESCSSHGARRAATRLRRHTVSTVLAVLYVWREDHELAGLECVVHQPCVRKWSAEAQMQPHEDKRSLDCHCRRVIETKS